MIRRRRRKRRRDSSVIIYRESSVDHNTETLPHAVCVVIMGMETSVGGG